MRRTPHWCSRWTIWSLAFVLMEYDLPGVDRTARVLRERMLARKGGTVARPTTD